MPFNDALLRAEREHAHTVIRSDQTAHTYVARARCERHSPSFPPPAASEQRNGVATRGPRRLLLLTRPWLVARGSLSTPRRRKVPPCRYPAERDNTVSRRARGERNSKDARTVHPFTRCHPPGCCAVTRCWKTGPAVCRTGLRGRRS